MTGEDNHLDSLYRFDTNIAMTVRILIGTDRSREQMCQRFPFWKRSAYIRERPSFRIKSLSD